MYTILLFYKYTKVNDTNSLAFDIRTLATRLNLKGRVVIAEEGLNATLEGKTEDTNAFLKEIKKDKRFEDINVKESEGDGNVFPKLSVKIRDEIVSTKFPKEIDPTVKTGKKLSAEELRKWFSEKKDFVIVDMRNSYELNSGYFKDSMHMDIKLSRQLVDKVDTLKEYKDKKVLTVCTGGVRCEKMSAYLISKGFEDVHQLDGGIHTYMQKYPGEDFLGALYTFDNRVTMHFGGERDLVGKCLICGEGTEEYYNCANDECHIHFLACDSCVDSVVDSDYVFCSKKCLNNPERVSKSRR